MKRLVILILASIVFLIVGAGITGIYANKALEAPQETSESVSIPSEPPKPPEISKEKLWEFTNAERAKAGVAPLQLDARLNASSTDKCNDMVQKDYWSHNAPNGTEPWVFIEPHYSYRNAGENLYYTNKYFTDFEKRTVTDWMGSAEHRNNLLDAKFTMVGFGICNYTELSKQGINKALVVQHLASPR